MVFMSKVLVVSYSTKVHTSQEPSMLAGKVLVKRMRSRFNQKKQLSIQMQQRSKELCRSLMYCMISLLPGHFTWRSKYKAEITHLAKLVCNCAMQNWILIEWAKQLFCGITYQMISPNKNFKYNKKKILKYYIFFLLWQFIMF